MAAENQRDRPFAAHEDAATGVVNEDAATEVVYEDLAREDATREARGARDVVAPRSRVGGLWVAAVVFALVLLLLLIFVLQNGQTAEVSFFGAHWRLPMGVALLLAAVFGVLLVALPGTARIVQLRVLRRRRRPEPPHAATRQAKAPVAPAPSPDAMPEE